MTNEPYIIGIKHGLPCINICQVLIEMLKLKVKKTGVNNRIKSFCSWKTFKSHLKSSFLHLHCIMGQGYDDGPIK